MKTFGGKVAAITGAGSGIGRALAEELAGRGCHLALSDVDEAGLAETVLRCERSGVKVTPTALDVSDRDAVFRWADQVVDDHGRSTSSPTTPGSGWVPPPPASHSRTSNG